MMKFLLLILFVPFFSYSQDTVGIARLPVDANTKLVTYKVIYTVSKSHQDSLFKELKKLLIYNYRAQGNPIQFEDKSVGKIIAKGQKSIITTYKAGIAGSIPTPSTISYILTFNVEQNDVDVTLDSFGNNYNGNFLPIEQAFQMFSKVKRTKQTIATENGIADNINLIAKEVFSNIEKTLPIVEKIEVKQ